MKKILTIMLPLLLGGMAAQAADYLPLVREGVVWHYVYWNCDDEAMLWWPFCTELNVQFI